MEKLLTIQWVIFGISATLFVLWIALFSNINTAEPKFSKSIKGKQKLQYLELVEDYFFYSQKLFKTASMLLINITVLIFVSGYFYLRIQNDFSMFIQNLTIFSFYLSTNTLILLLLDILEPIFVKKKEITLQSKKFDLMKTELLETAKMEMITDEFNSTVCKIKDIIMNDKNISDEEKQNLKENMETYIKNFNQEINNKK